MQAGHIAYLILSCIVQGPVHYEIPRQAWDGHQRGVIKCVCQLRHVSRDTVLMLMDDRYDDYEMLSTGSPRQ